MPRQSLGSTGIPTVQPAVAIAIKSSRMQQRFGTLFQVTSRLPALPADLAHRILDAAARLGPKIARDGWIDKRRAMRSVSSPLWASFQSEITN